MKCEVCGRKLEYRSWSEAPIGIIESITECEWCGYTAGWSYGERFLILNGKYYHNRRQFDKEIRTTRKYYKRTGKFLRGNANVRAEVCGSKS